MKYSSPYLRKIGLLRRAHASVTTVAEQELYRDKYVDMLTSLGGDITPSLAQALMGASSVSEATRRGAQMPAPPLDAATVVKAVKKSAEELVAREQPPLSNEALLFLADIFWSGLRMPDVSIPRDQAKAAELWRAAGERGDGEGAYRYAMCLLQGEGAPEHRDRATTLLNELVEKGHVQATYSLAVLLSAQLEDGQPLKRRGGARSRTPPQKKLGMGGKKSAVVVYGLLRRAIAGGVVPAVHNMGNLLAEGAQELPRDDEAALEMFTAGTRRLDAPDTFDFSHCLVAKLREAFPTHRRRRAGGPQERVHACDLALSGPRGRGGLGPRLRASHEGGEVGDATGHV